MLRKVPRFTRKDPSVAALLQDDSMWRTVAALLQDDIGGVRRSAEAGRRGSEAAPR